MADSGLAQGVRQDRILSEAEATGGDIHALCDMFGLSVASAYRYGGVFHYIDYHPGDTDAAPRDRQ